MNTNQSAGEADVVPVGSATLGHPLSLFVAAPAIPATSVCICAPAGSAEAGAVAVFDRLAR
jgi:hypothetical protein